MTCLFICSISSSFILDRLYLSKNFFHFFLVVHFIGIQLPPVFSYDSCYFCGINCNFYFFTSNFIDLSPLPFFLDESGLKFISCVYLYKEQSAGFIIAIVFFASISFICAMNFMISTTNFRFYVLFLP